MASRGASGTTNERVPIAIANRFRRHAGAPMMNATTLKDEATDGAD